MADDEYKKTENFINELEQDDIKWKRLHGDQMLSLMKNADEVLASGDQKARQELLHTFQDERIREAFMYTCRPEIGYMFVIMRIYQDELNNSEPHTILDMGKSYKEILAVLQQVKFYLWRVEFTDDSASRQQFVDYIKEHQISTEMILAITDTSSFDKVYVLTELADTFIGNKMLGYAFHILEGAEALDPSNETVLCFLALLCGYAERKDRAAEYLSRIKNPSDSAERLREMYGC